MRREDILNQVIEYAANAFKKNINDISETTIIKDELGTGSMQRIVMCSLIENDMDVVIPVMEFGKYETIGDLVNKIISEM